VRAVVTGAASGIGLAVSRRLAAAGGSVLMVDVAETVLERAAELGQHGLVCDLAHPHAGGQVAAEARTRLGGCDALVSNAGIAEATPLLELDVDRWERTFAINTRATFLLAKALHPLLADGGGAIVATASIASVVPAPPMGAYAASKAALAMLVRQMAYEWGGDGIRASCVSPGMTHTGLTDTSYSDPELRAERGARVPLGRIGEPDDIAAAIEFLLSPAASYVTGVNLLVDGGMDTCLLPAIRGITPP
jgi:NAD(P)-dependent dehydrogenase (short-subunit alcohol dehydrogenase family)